MLDGPWFMQDAGTFAPASTTALTPLFSQRRLWQSPAPIRCDSTQRLTSVTLPSGLITTNLYLDTGSDPGQLQATVDYCAFPVAIAQSKVVGQKSQSSLPATNW